MANVLDLRRRIRSVKNTRQITKAMQMVSASRLRRLQESAQATQAYSKYARELLTQLKRQHEVAQFPFYQERPIKKRLLIIVTSDRGLAGAYNSNVLKTYLREVQQDRAHGVETATICYGRQGSTTLARVKDTEVMGAYTNLPEKPALSDIEAGINSAIAAFRNGEVDAVDVIYTHFKNTITQSVTTQRILPAGFSEEEVSAQVQAAEFEPSIEAVLEKTTIRLVEAQLLQAVLESGASEWAMRMMAMKNATDNAGELIDEYTLEYNNARQAAITQELAEITGGVEAMK